MEEITRDIKSLSKRELDQLLLSLIDSLIKQEHRATLEQAARLSREMVGANREEIADAIEALP